MADIGAAYATLPNFWATWDFGGQGGTFRQTGGKNCTVTNPGTGLYQFVLGQGGLAQPYEVEVQVGGASAGNLSYMTGLADDSNTQKTLSTARGNNVLTDVDHGYIGFRRLAQ